MANDGSPGARAGGGRRCGTVTRVDLLTFLLAAALCSASYCLGIWHNSRGAADSKVLGPSAALLLGAASSSCGGGDADEAPLDFEAHHTAEAAGLSVSTSSSSAAAAAASANARRALRGAAPGRTGHRGVAAWAARVSGGGLRFESAEAVRA